MRAHPGCALHEQAGGVDLGGDVGDLLVDAGVVERRLAVDRRLGEVLERELVGGAGDSDRACADERARQLKGCQRVCASDLLAAAGVLKLLVELVHAAEQVLGRDAAVFEHDLGGLRSADAELVFLLALREAGRVLRDDERGLAAGAELGVDAATTTVTSAIPPLVMKTLEPLRTHSSPSSLAVVRSDLTSEPADGSVTA